MVIRRYDNAMAGIGRETSDRRTALRFDIDDYTLVFYRIGTLQRVGFRKKNIGRTVRNISMTGASLVLDGSVKVGQTVQMLLILNKFKDVFEAQGTVRWVKESKLLPDRFEVGVHFKSIDPVHNRKLQNMQGWFTSVAYRVQKELGDGKG